MRCSTKTVARCDHNNTTNTNSTLHPQCLHCEHHHNKTEGGNRGMQAQFFCEIECQADPNTLFASVHAGRAGAAHANPALRLSTFGLTSPDQAPTCWFSPWKSRFTSLYLWAYVPLWGAHMLVFPIKITLYVPLPLGFLWAYVPLWGAYTGKTDCSPNSISESSQARLRSKPSEALSELFQRTCQGCHAVEI